LLQRMHADRAARNEALRLTIRRDLRNALRICRGFENHFDKRDDYHARLIQRLVLELPGIRPEFIPKTGISIVRELKGFKHVVRHAYDLEFRAPRVAELTQMAESLATELPGWTASFASRVKAEQRWT
jgi:hypothetical protein